VAPVDGTYLFGATLLYKVNASTSARMSGRLVLNGTTETPSGGWDRVGTAGEVGTQRLQCLETVEGQRMPELDFVRYVAKQRASAMRFRRSGGISGFSLRIKECR